MSKAFAPRGTQLQHGDAATPPNYTTVAEVTKIDITGSKADLPDVTNMDSPTAYREFLATLLDAGEINFECNFVPGSAPQKVLESDFDGQVNAPYKIVLPNALGEASFDAFVSSRDFALPIDKQGTRTVKLKITGAMATTW
jgi:predicted secreted protein